MIEVLKEIEQIPVLAEACLRMQIDFTLPRQVPYVGMGSSYFAATAFKYMGFNIQPEIASEFFHYGFHDLALSQGVILSQSGESTETLWSTTLFKQYIAITNSSSSSLATRANVSDVILLQAGEEKYSSTKTYINTLLTLFKGFGIDTQNASTLLKENFERYRRVGLDLAENIYALITKQPIHGIYILGSGPNIATAQEAALILSETTKRSYNGMAMAQYDHGPKENAQNSIVIQIVSQGPAYERTKGLTSLLRKSGAYVFEVEERKAEENLSVIHNIVPFNFMAYYLAYKLNVTEIFSVGSKVTTV